MLLNKIKKIIPDKLFKKLQPIYHYGFAWLAAFVYRFPSEKLIVIGVTGTTGKTTSVYLIAKMLQNAGYKTGYTSTAMFNDGEKEWLNDKKMTMVGRFFTQSMLKKMVRNNCRYVVVETTSQGILQFRHRFINYDILVFTGLHPEHIEAHGGFENYKNAKGKLFEHLKNCRTKYANDQKEVIKTEKQIKKLDLKRVKKTIIANLDDENAKYFLNFWAEEKRGFTNASEFGADNSNIRDLKDLIVDQYGDIKIDSFGINFRIDKTKINLQLLGEFNVVNAMTAVSVGLNQDIEPSLIASSLGKITGVPGRFEKINEGQDFTVIVDYAYEPNAVTKLYKTIELIPHNKIIHVLGSTGGGRDEARRPLLGKLAGEKADFVIVTNEDPYDDDPQIIIDQVSLGAEKSGKKLDENLFKILDRKKAIKKALDLATKSDIVLITGKGSEQAICVANGEKIKWDDREVVKELLK